MQLLLIGGILFLLFRGASKYEAVQMLSYRPRSIKVERRSALEYLLNIPLTITLDVINQTNEPIYFEALSGNVSLGGKSFPILARPENNGEIKAQSTSRLGIRIDVSTAKTLGIIRDALGGNPPKFAQLKGRILFKGGLTLPIDNKFDFSFS